MELLLVTGNGRAGMFVNRDERAEDGWMGGERGRQGGRAGRFIGRGAVSFTSRPPGGCATRIRVLRPVGRRQLTRVGPFHLRRVPTRNCLGCALSGSLQV